MESLVFPAEEDGYPVWGMSLGRDYVRNYIMTDQGGGWYLEWHTDRPHFHMPLSEDAGGVYLLAKRENHKILHLTAFRIPYGKAIFTGRGVIHCDAGLTGSRWVVGYAKSDHFSTVLLRNTKEERISIRLIP